MKSLNTHDLAAIGGGSLVGIVDGACAVAIGAGVIGVALFPHVEAGCAIWAIGRWVTS